MKKLLFILALAISANTLAYDEASEHDEASEDEIYNSKAIVLDKSHKEFTIQLPSNPTTGYSWFIKDYDDRLVEPTKHQFISPKNEKVGAGGMETWTFKATRAAFEVPHMTQISFVYAQPWNLESVSDNVVTVITQ